MVTATGEEWHPDSPEFQAGLHDLVGSMVTHYEQLVEDQVFKIKLSLDSRRQESGKNAIKIDGSIKATRRYGQYACHAQNLSMQALHNCARFMQAT